MFYFISQITYHIISKCFTNVPPKTQALLGLSLYTSLTTVIIYNIWFEKKHKLK